MGGAPFGRYELVELLGQGGMGEVWRAYDTVTDREVAVKLLPPHLAGDAVFQERFRREARAAAGLNNPHVVPIHDFGEINGRLFVDMRLVEGVDLGTLLKAGPLPPRRAVRIVEQVALALFAAHRIGLVHRDVKPSNILVAEDDFAYLIDFGIARTAEDAGLTETGAAVGTWAYMAPERFATGEADARADVYALTCVLYEALTGHAPFRGKTLEQIATAHMFAPPPHPSAIVPQLGPEMDRVINTGMAKQPESRYGSTRDLATAARAAIGSEVPTQVATPVQTPHPPAGFADAATQHRAPAPQNPPPPPPARRRRIVLAATAAALVVIVAVVVAAVVVTGGSDAPTPTASPTAPAPNSTPRPAPSTSGIFAGPQPWTADVSGAPRSERSDAIIAALSAAGGWGTDNNLQIDFSNAVFFADADTPRMQVIGTEDYCGGGPACDAVPAQIPVPVNANIGGSADLQCDPSGNTEGQGDCQLLVVDRAGQKLYETYQSTKDGKDLRAAGLFIWDLTKQYPVNLRGDQCTGADAGGFPIAAMTPTADDVASGSIDHALRFILPNDRIRADVYVHPASHAGGPQSSDPDAPPFGVRFRLRADFDETGYTESQRVVLTALKTHGMLLADGGQVPLTFADDRTSTAKWADLGIAADTFEAITPAAFEVVELGPDIRLTYDCVRNP
ncbi:serine/threonine-protein kinase [Mycobacterium sp. C31M]